MRTLISHPCEKHAPFKFVVMGDTRVCCSGDSLEGLCDECRAAASAKPAMRPPRAALPPVAREHQDAGSRTYGVPPQRKEREKAPPPPSLADALRKSGERAGSGLAALHRKLTRTGEAGLAVLPGVGTNVNGVPNPPRLAGGR
jgi:hypothetical protein